MLKPINQCSQAGAFASRDAPLPLPLSPAATVFLTSSRHNGVASKGHVFPANQHSIVRVKLPRRPLHSWAKSELLHEGARVNSKPELRLWACVQVLVRCGKQAFSQVLELRNHCCLSTSRPSHPSTGAALHFMARGLPMSRNKMSSCFLEGMGTAPDTDTDFYACANLPFVSCLRNNRVFTRQSDAFQ